MDNIVIIEYQRNRAVACRTVKNTKKRNWRELCSTIGREVKLGDVWNMFQQMSGKRKHVKIPALIDGEKMAASDKEKTEVLGKAFAAVHSGEHLDKIHRQQKERVSRENGDRRERREEDMSTLDMEITMAELKLALTDTGYIPPGQDQLCYAMFRHLPAETLKLVRRLFNKMWTEGVIPSCWTTAVILPFNKIFPNDETYSTAR